MADPPPETIVLDTDVASFLFNQDVVRAPRYLAHIRGKRACLPFVTVAELRFGAELRNWGVARRARHERFLLDFRIIHSDSEILTNWAVVRTHAQRSGKTIERQDAWVAAVAMTLRVPLLTHNHAHFRGVPLLQVTSEPDH